MVKPLKVECFTPPKFSRKSLNKEFLKKYNFIYSSAGRYSLYHILKSLKIKGKILIPAYICSSVLVPIKLLGLTPIFCDMDIEDLNPSITSMKYMVEKYSPSAVLIASMYGNPANLTEAELFLKEKNIPLIDDGAQSFGAKLDNRYISTFGDGGFFSFSPGKTTAGHLGSFFRTKK